MSLGRAEAGAELAAIEDVVARVKQSRIYRTSGNIVIMWGGAQIVQYLVASLSQADAGWSWLVVDALGIALTVWMVRRASPGGTGAPGLKILAAFALFYGFGFVWSALIGHLGARETAVFWHTLFLFGYCLAGLWFGVAFLVIGLGLAAAVIAVYLFVQPPLFWLLIALVTGFGYGLCGLWMRRA